MPVSLPETAARTAWRRFVPRSVLVLGYRDFALVTSGNVISALGTWSQYVGIGWAAKTMSASNFLLGLAFAAQFIPSLVLAPFAGLLADRFDRRLTVIWGNLGMAGPAAAIGVLAETHHLTVGWLLVLAMAGGVLQVMTMPASQAIIPQLVPPAEMQQAVSMNSAANNATRLIGPGLGGAAIRLWGLQWAFYLNAVSFLAVVAAWLLVRARLRLVAAAPEPFLQRLGGGLRYARQNPLVGRLLVLSSVVTFCCMQAPLLPVFSRDVLGGGVSTYALLSAMPGLGAVVAALIAGELVSPAARRAAVIGGAVLSGVAILTVGVSRSLVLSAGMQALFGVGYFTLSTMTATILVLATVDSYRGRVMALLTMSSAGTVPVTSVTAGLVASGVGVRQTVALAGGLILACLAVFLGTGRLRSVDHVHPPPEGVNPPREGANPPPEGVTPPDGPVVGPAPVTA